MSRHTMLMTLMGGLVLGTGCPDVYGKGGKLDRAMEKDIDELHGERKRELRMQGVEMEEDEEGSCPEDKVEVRDCTSLSCKVECQ
ncbi:hypothetical protein JQX13_13980 [Archangium violaceum]|uniref:hypothetical protein n=1 Tax=Archangium violaceum TaxID=83451 RepID=UPI00193B83FA|nr:hypothetical protein [Archangium violaceum]QRK11075.1 hypothetical protein JQX13_13980 [Archangium violaceum]